MGYWDKKEAKKTKDDEFVEVQAEDSLESLEQDCLEVVDEIHKGFRDRMKKENKRFMDMCDTEYWFCVCFSSREQKDEFLQKVGLNPEMRYYDGKEVAKAFRKSIKTPDLEFAKIRPYDKDYLERTME